MIETEPSVSTAGRRRMMAWREAIRWTPMARVTVRIAGSPSGMAATARPTTTMNISVRENARSVTPKRKTRLASTRMATVSQRAKTFIWRSSGVESWRTSVSMPLMRPISVRGPVSTTTPAPCPAATSVPA